jgi:cytidylate kinase
MTARDRIEDVVQPFLLACAHPDRRDRSFGQTPPGRRPFVTITRDTGAGGWAVAQALAESLNRQSGAERWRAFDRELVEKVAADHHISRSLVESLEDGSRSWLEEMIASGPESSFGVYRRVATTIRALAEVGGAIIVGRGGVFVTRNLAGGIHAHLVAPFAHRVQRVAEKQGMTEGEATKVIRESDENRRAFHRRWWPKQEMTPEIFAVTLNSAILNDAVMVQVLSTLVSAQSA